MSPATGALGSKATRKRRSWRVVLLAVHRWTGLTIGLVVVVSAVSGAAMAFREQLEPLVYPHMLRASSCAEHRQVDELITRAQAAYPQGRLSYVRIQNRPGLPWVVRFAGDENVFVDPCSGRVLGRQNRYGGLFGSIEAIHQARYMPKGDVLVGVGALAFATLLIGGGVALWWPRSRAALRPSLTLNRNLKGRAFLLNLHRTIGIYAAGVILISAATGVPRAFSWAKQAIYGAAGSPMTSAPAAPAHAKDAAMIRMEDAWRTSQSLSPGATEVLIHRPNDAAHAVEAYIIAGDAPHPNARTYLYLDAVSGDVLSYRPYAQSSLGSKLYYWMLSIHTGKAGGLAGQLVLFSGALAVPVLACAGIASYLCRRFGKSAPRRA